MRLGTRLFIDLFICLLLANGTGPLRAFRLVYNRKTEDVARTPEPSVDVFNFELSDGTVGAGARKGPARRTVAGRQVQPVPAGGRLSGPKRGWSDRRGTAYRIIIIIVVIIAPTKALSCTTLQKLHTQEL